jgi:hypothetical protein
MESDAGCRRLAYSHSVIISPLKTRLCGGLWLPGAEFRGPGRLALQFVCLSSRHAVSMFIGHRYASNRRYNLCSAVTPDRMWYRIYKNNSREAKRMLGDEVQGLDRAVHRVDILKDVLTTEEQADGWGYYRSTKGTSKPQLDHPAKTTVKRKPNTRRRRR